MQNLEDSRVQTERTLRLNMSNSLNQMDKAVKSWLPIKRNMAMAEKALHQPQTI